MNWKKSDIPLILNGLFVGCLFWGIGIKNIGIFDVICLIGSYITLIGYGNFVKKEDE
jgi:hypothetical protein